MGYNKKCHFVISKIDILTKIVRNPYAIEPLEKQVYYEFEKTKESESLPLEKATFEIYRVQHGADEDFNLIATDAEIIYCNENKKHIKRMREKAKAKDDELCRSNITQDEFDRKVWPEIKMPVPNHQHCGVCKVNYEDYTAHVESKEHAGQIALQKNFYDIIDVELADINLISKTKKWKSSPVHVKKMPSPLQTSAQKPEEVLQLVQTAGATHFQKSNFGGATSNISGENQNTLNNLFSFPSINQPLCINPTRIPKEFEAEVAQEIAQEVNHPTENKSETICIEIDQTEIAPETAT